MPDHAQNNILISPDGHACLGEFGITGTFRCFDFYVYELETLRYMAPECFIFWRFETSDHSKESDIYSLAVTSYSVCSSVVTHPPT